MKDVGPKQAQIRAMRERNFADARSAPKAERLQRATELARHAEKEAAPSEKAKKGRARVGRADGVVKEIENTLAEMMAEIANPSQPKEKPKPKPKQKQKRGKPAPKIAPDPEKRKLYKREYQRKLMRDRRAKAKAAKETGKE